MAVECRRIHTRRMCCLSDSGLFVYGCDLSSTAIQLLRVSECRNLVVNNSLQTSCSGGGRVWFKADCMSMPT